MKVLVPEPDQVPLTVEGAALVMLELDTILVTVTLAGTVVVELTFVMLKAEPAVTLLGAVAEMVIGIPRHSTLVEYAAAKTLGGETWAAKNPIAKTTAVIVIIFIFWFLLNPCLFYYLCLDLNSIYSSSNDSITFGRSFGSISALIT